MSVPVKKMLEGKHGIYGSLGCDLKPDGSYKIDDVIARIDTDVIYWPNSDLWNGYISRGGQRSAV